MIKKIKQVLVSLALASFLVVPAVPAVVSAQNIQGGLNCGSSFDLKAIDGSENPACGGTDEAAGDKLNGIIRLIVNIFSLIVGVIAVIMIIIGGLKYITSGGDSGNISGAKNTILYAVVGLVVVALAQFVVRFVLNKVGTASQG